MRENRLGKSRLRACMLINKTWNTIKFFHSLSTKFKPSLHVQSDKVRQKLRAPHDEYKGLSPVLHGKSRESYQSQTRTYCMEVSGPRSS